MGNGFVIGGGLQGFASGIRMGLAIKNNQEILDGRKEDRAYRRERAGIADSQWQQSFDQNKQALDLGVELKGLQITAAKDKQLMTRGKYVSKAMRAAMSGPDGSQIDPEGDFFKSMAPAEVQRRFDVINSGMHFMANEGGFMKNYLGANQAGSIDAENPVAGFSLLQSDQGNMGVAMHMNKKDGTTGVLDYPNRKDGQGTVIPADVFSDMAWQTSGIFLDDKLTERQKLGVQHTNKMNELRQTGKNARALERVKYSHTQKKDSRTPMRKNMEYLVESGIAKTLGEALKLTQQAKRNPLKLVMDRVAAVEENQLLMSIMPGDPRHKNRATLINETLKLIDEINGKTEQAQPDPDPQQGGDMVGHAAPQGQPQQAGGLPPQAAAQLQEGGSTSFANGQIWMLQGGKPVRLK